MRTEPIVILVILGAIGVGAYLFIRKRAPTEDVADIRAVEAFLFDWDTKAKISRAEPEQRVGVKVLVKNFGNIAGGQMIQCRGNYIPTYSTSVYLKPNESQWTWFFVTAPWEAGLYQIEIVDQEARLVLSLEVTGVS